MRPESGQVLHFSEDPAITRFTPHVAATARQAEPYVWAVDADRSPDYWFPRQCPRAMAWTTPSSTDADRDRIIGAGSGDRVHAIEYGWLDAMRTVRLFAYRLPADRFRPFGRHPTRTSPPNRSSRSARPNPSATCSTCTSRQASSCACSPTSARSGRPCSPAASASAASACATPGRLAECVGPGRQLPQTGQRGLVWLPQ